MTTQPILPTNRLMLRPFSLSDAARVQLLAGDRRVSVMTVNIPYPYADGLAELWISSHAASYQQGDAIIYAITLAHNDELIGTVSLTQRTSADANLGYWIGVPYWGQGYCTEAAAALLEFGLKQCGIPLIYARHLQANPASGRVMLKNGFRHIRTLSLDIHGETLIMEHYERSA